MGQVLRVRGARLLLAACACTVTLAITVVPSASGAGTAPKADSGWHEIGRFAKATSLGAIAFADLLHGCAVGAGGEIVVTSDGGRTWEDRDSGTGATLSSVAFGDAMHAWAVGSEGVIVATSDGGATWKPQRSGTSADLYGVEFTDANHGLVSYDDSNERERLISTSNGGRTWKPAKPGRKMPSSNVVWADARHGWRLWSDKWNSILLLASTSDGGRHWTRRQVGSLEEVADIAFADALHGWVLSNYHAIFATSDGGATWQFQRAGDPGFVHQVTFTDRLHGLVISADSGFTSYVFRTADGGRTWSAQSPGGFLGRILMADATHGLLEGHDGTATASYYTDDGAVSWHRLGPIPLATVDQCGIADATHFWATDNAGLTVLTGDGGRTWTMLDLGAQGRAYCPAPGKIEEMPRKIPIGKDAAGHQLSRTVGESAILSTSDGGRTWQKQFANTANLSGVTRTDGPRGWAVNRDGIVMATANAGRTWSKISAEATRASGDVQFVDEAHGWAFTGDEAGFGAFQNVVVLGTTDGGRTWKKQPLPQIPWRGSEMAFADASHGWIIERGGRVFATTNGGFPPGSPATSTPSAPKPPAPATGGCTNPALQH